MTDFDWMFVGVLTSLAIGWLTLVVALIAKQNVKADEVMRRLEREHLV